MNLFVKRVSLVAVFGTLAGVTVVSRSPLQLDFVRDAEAVVVRAVAAPVARAAVVGTVAVSSANQAAAASANQQAAAANQQAAAAATASANAAAASANAAAAAAKAAPPAAPAGPPPVGTIVTVLPPGCTPTKLNGVDYQRCGTTYYTVAMMGTSLVFVVAQP